MKKKKTVKDHVLNILLVFFILVFLGSGGYLGYYYYSINKSESRADELEEKIENDDEFADEDFYYATVGDAEKGKEALSMYVEVDGKMILRKYSKLYQENTDFIGWLYIPGTKVGYPVMFTPNDEEFYLRKNFDKEYRRREPCSTTC